MAAPVARGAAESPAPVKVSYFRSDRGVADSGAGPLPDRFDAPGALRWRVPTDSGHSTPALFGGRIFLTTYRAADRELATVALDEKTGELIWKQVAPIGRIEAYHQQTGNPAAATPACDGRRLYVFFGSYGMLCYDLDGKVLWDVPMGPFQDEFGAGSSPILVDDKVILNQDHDVDSFLIAMDPYTGRTIWKQARPDAVRSYSTPSVWTRDGKKQLLVAGALDLTSYDAETGEPQWWVHGLARIVIPIPVPGSEMIYMASWSPGGDAGARIGLESWDRAVAKWDGNADGRLTKTEIDDREVLSRFFRMDLDQSGALDKTEWDRHAAVFERAQNVVMALKPTGRGDLTEEAVVWKYPRGVPYVTTPLLHDNILWMVKDGGIVTKLDAATGELLQQERVPGFGNYYASPVTGDGKVYIAGELGVVSVIAGQRDWMVVSSHDFDERIYATPVIDGDRIFIRTEEALYCYTGRRSVN